MFVYFKGYSIGICAIAVALPVIASTLWPMFTGQMMASTFGGMLLMLALFAVGMLLGWAIFSKLADSKVQAMIDAYNNTCDPSRLISGGANIAAQVSYPCNQMDSWFMSYYAQALLDSGNSQLAKNILGGLRLSIDAAKKPQEKAGILVNYLPLDQKMEGFEQALRVVDEGIAYCKQFSGGQSASCMEYLDSQKKILLDLVSSDKDKAVAICERIKKDSAYPQRLRVEYAWIEASMLYGASDTAKEKSCLDFVIRNGSKLALAEKAKARLSEM